MSGQMGMDAAALAFRQYQSTSSPKSSSPGMHSNAGVSSNISVFGENSSVVSNSPMSSFPNGSSIGEISFAAGISNHGIAELVGKAFCVNIVRAGDGENITHASPDMINGGPMASPKVVGAVSLNAAGGSIRSHAGG